MEHVDVLIIGAGLSGISAAWHLQHRCPGKSFLIVEARGAIGGTWDLFRYPGIRSDSDMYTLGYRFRPWRNAKAIADGPAILDYVRDTAREHDIERHIRFNQRARRASWSSADARWIVETEGADGQLQRYSCNFIYSCSGYYDYAQGYTPDFPGMEKFRGRIVHPQKWTDDIDYAGKKVVVIGSGATAVTLVPAMTDKAAHVTMLQRSPTYILSLPAQDKIANFLRAILPAKVAYGITRWKNVLLGMFMYFMCRHYPEAIKRMIKKGVRKELPPGYDVRTHFTPSYNPWDQRLCLVPDADLFKALREGRASIVTDHIDTFTERGLKLKSGAELEADLIVTATGLNLLALGGIELTVDGQHVEMSKTLAYKGMMFTGVPNLAVAIGYTNASWTLKCDLTCEYVCRLLNDMDRRGVTIAVPRNNDPTVKEEPLIGFSSSYVVRSIDKFPRQGSRAPWRLYQNYARDIFALRYAALDDGAMVFASAGAAVTPATQAAS